MHMPLAASIVTGNADTYARFATNEAIFGESFPDHAALKLVFCAESDLRDPLHAK